jgi:hypothetical protein
MMTFEETVMWNRLTDQVGNYYTEAAEPERESFRIWLKGLLHTDKITVEFIKSDGSTRVMNCTLNKDLGAKYHTKENVIEHREPRKVNNDSCPVWDCDANAWRSFRWDRLKRIDYKIG